jgi:TetR/AcrR family transcriptional repressor of mexCD-oprJ operon
MESGHDVNSGLMTRSPVLRDHIASGLLDVAAVVLAERGTQASMSDIAEAAGVSRATLYRYFPNREALLGGLKDAAMADLSARLGDARLDAVPAGEAIARLTRALVAAASKYRALEGFGKTAAEEAEAQAAFAAPVLALFERGAREGAFRPDLPARTLSELYLGLLEGVIRRTLDGRLGAEEASAAITSVFLDGAGPGQQVPGQAPPARAR